MRTGGLTERKAHFSFGLFKYLKGGSRNSTRESLRILICFEDGEAEGSFWVCVLKSVTSEAIGLYL